MCYCPTPKRTPHRRLCTLLSQQKKLFWKVGTWGNVLISPPSPCNTYVIIQICPHSSTKTRTHTHTTRAHTHTHTHTHTPHVARKHTNTFKNTVKSVILANIITISNNFFLCVNICKNAIYCCEQRWIIHMIKTFSYKRLLFHRNAVLLDFLFIKVSWKIKCIAVSPNFFFKLTQLFSTLLIMRNVSWAANQYIRMISEESCDTEDWSNDAENTALITEINYIWSFIHM